MPLTSPLINLMASSNVNETDSRPGQISLLLARTTKAEMEDPLRVRSASIVKRIIV
jgi:hypothetical protein